MTTALSFSILNNTVSDLESKTWQEKTIHKPIEPEQLLSIVTFSFLPNLLMNLLFLIPLIVWAGIQAVKVLIDYTVEKKISIDNLRGSWGFPSVHSGIASSVCTLVMFYTGVESVEFAITITFSFLFWYDAANIRFEAGQHASSLNQITKELHELDPSQKTLEQHKERLWHTKTEVIWWILAWILITLLLLTIIW